jgi:hypothetical protein
MKTISFVLATFLAVAPPSESLMTTISRYAQGIQGALTGIGTMTIAAWDKIGEGQAPDILQDVATDAATLQTKKDGLRAELLLCMQEKSNPPNLYGEVENLRKLVRRLGEKLEKFAHEIDKAAHPVGEDLRVEISKAETNKIIELHIVVIDWEMGKRQEAVESLDGAVADLKRMRAGVLCLQESIKRKNTACDVKTLTLINEKPAGK